MTTHQSKLDRVYSSFLIPPWIVDIVSPLDVLLAETDPQIVELARVFRANVSAVVSTCGVPYQLIAESVFRLRFQQLLSIEAVRRAPFPGEAPEPGSEQEARLAAHAQFRSEVESEEKVHALQERVFESLSQSLSSEEFSTAAAELLRQGAVLSWGALEVLAQDLFTHVVNSRPDIGLKLLQDDATKRLFQMKAVSLDILAQNDFDISRRLGSILVEERAVDTIPVMKSVYSVLFSDSVRTAEAFGAPHLWLLNQRRHLIVHRRGFVDRSYVDNTGDSLPLGFQITISSDVLVDYLRAVVELGAYMLTEGRRCLAHQG